MKIRKIAQTPGLVATVVDNLISTSKVDALSANQGKILNENKLNFEYSKKTGDISILVNKMRFTVLEGAAMGSNVEVDFSSMYPSLNGTVVTSFVIGQANTQSNINVTSLVPTINQGTYWNYVARVRVFSNSPSATTLVHVGVFYIPNE